MTTPPHEFNRLAENKPSRYRPPFSLRLSFQERAQLERDAAGKSLGAYIREELFGKNVTPRRAARKLPIKDHEERRDALASMRNIEDELATRAPGFKT